jgi:hypothetical protein
LERGLLVTVAIILLTNLENECRYRNSSINIPYFLSHDILEFPQLLKPSMPRVSCFCFSISNTGNPKPCWDMDSNPNSNPKRAGQTPLFPPAEFPQVQITADAELANPRPKLD